MSLQPNSLWSSAWRSSGSLPGALTQWWSDSNLVTRPPWWCWLSRSPRPGAWGSWPRAGVQGPGPEPRWTHQGWSISQPRILPGNRNKIAIRLRSFDESCTLLIILLKKFSLLFSTYFSWKTSWMRQDVKKTSYVILSGPCIFWTTVFLQ